MSRNRNSLFSRGDLYSALQNQKAQAANAVKALSSDQIQASTDDQLITHFMDKFAITPVTVYPDRVEKTIAECQFETRDSFTYDIRDGESIKVPGIAVTVRMPFTGEGDLLMLQPSMYSLTGAYADITKPDKNGIGWLTYQFSFNQHGVTADNIQQTINSAINFTAQMTGNQAGQIKQFEHELRQELQATIDHRRSSLGGIHSLAKALDIPLASRTGMPSLTPIAVARKVIHELPPVADARQSMGFSITDRSYANILAAIRAQGRTFEKTPTTFAKFDEEELRDVILGNLNTHFQGQATGETFRAKGKTDICIEQDNRAAFVGECKIWRGPQELVAGLQQLLGYLTWRDCKTALVVFNRDRSKFSELLDKAPTTLRQYSELFHGEVAQPEPGEWQMTFKAPGDENRIITVQLMVYNLYTI